MAQKEPFLVYVHPVFRVLSCPAKLAEESRGLIGFHSFTTCADCHCEPEGFEFWGVNGHRQGHVLPEWDLASIMAQRALSRNERFESGATIYYRGN